MSFVFTCFIVSNDVLLISVPVQCPPECKSCDGQGCTACRPGRILEQSRCVDACSDGFFQATDTQCQGKKTTVQSHESGLTLEVWD